MTIDLHKLFDIFDNKCHLTYWHNKSTAVIDLFYLQSDYVEILFSIIAYGDRISFRIIIYPCEMIKNTIKTNAIRNIYVYGLFVVQQLSLLRLSLSLILRNVFALKIPHQQSNMKRNLISSLMLVKWWAVNKQRLCTGKELSLNLCNEMFNEKSLARVFFLSKVAQL